MMEPFAAPAEPRASLAGRAYLELRERLVLLDIPPGAPLNEQELAGELGVGRTPLREAIKRLENEHFLETYPRRGTFATRVDATALSEISEVRRVLEPLAARRAASQLDATSRSSIEQVRAELGALDPTSSTRESMVADMRVHSAIYQVARNEHLARSLTHYLFLAMRIWCLAVARMDAVGGHITEHERILDAILARDADGSAQLMLEHMTGFETAIRRVL